MLRNYFTLYHVARELHEEIAGGYLFEIHSQDRNELTISFVTADGRHLQLIVTVRSREFSLSTREGLNRKRRNSAGILTRAYELQVAGVDMAPRDREIRISLDGGWLIVIRFFSADTNVLLVHEGRIVDAFKDAKELEGTAFDRGTSDEPVFRSLELIAGDKSRFRELLEASGEELSLDRRLASFLPGFDRDLARRLIARNGGGHTPESLFRSLGAILYELASPSPGVTESIGKPPEFSILEPPVNSDPTPFDGVLEAMSHYTRRMHRFLHLQGGAVDLRKSLRQQLERTEKELAELESADPLEAAGKYETYGHLLTGIIGTGDTANAEVSVPNIFEPGAPEVRIPVRPDLNLQQNAAWYFSRATKSREKIKATEARRALLDARLRSLRLKLDQLDIAESEDGLRQLIGKSGIKKRAATGQGRKQEERQARFRTVPLTDDITLYVGKDAANNELLTFGHARPDDIWLHAQGASGSHCVLKGAAMHNMSEIRRAAEIAAWYSAAKNSGLVPVMYALKKHVRKAKSAPGSVNVEREKVIMVKPRKE
jgi:predicted ribosome quality control (RQC) complex YloA/Tae2 family protein